MKRKKEEIFSARESDTHSVTKCIQACSGCVAIYSHSFFNTWRMFRGKEEEMIRVYLIM